MLSINRVIIVGKLVGILPQREAKGLLIQEIEVETEESYYDKMKNERSNRTDKVRVTLFGKVVEDIKNIDLMAAVLIEGKVKSHTYKSKDGKEYDSTTVVANRVGKIESGFTAALDERDVKSKPPVVTFEDFNDDIPF